MESSELRLFADLIGEKIVTALPAAIAAGIARADAERADATEAARMAGLKEMRANTDASFENRVRGGKQGSSRDPGSREGRQGRGGQARRLEPTWQHAGQPVKKP